ncbi:MAG: glycoside hydrolase, partial [Acidobacteriaceae bacterium]|nr:glycoside hydrolase [Acidobacteriaceae bacterium]
MRWWWFGSAITRGELERELKAMKAAGIGGVEIQPVYPLELDDPQRSIRNLPYLSDDFLEKVRFTSELARQLEMRVDVTLGSGWPYGGPHTPITEGAGRLRCDRINIPENETTMPVPAMENGEKLIAVFLANGERRQFSAEGVQRLTQVENGRVMLPPGLQRPHVLLFFIASRTGQQVKRAAVGAEGFVLDHYSRSAVEHHLTSVADRLLQSFGSHPPHSVFSDSLEVFGSDWTDDLLPEFQKRRGYDLEPHLPELVTDSPESAAIRHDWGKTLTELAEERYLTPIRDWAHAHGTLFRSQTYGEPPVILSSNESVDLPEGEAGPKWRTFSAARWASSASHIYGRSVTSAETWTWLHSPAFRATPLDMKAEADLHFLQGINQLVGHGWPYSPESAGEPGWRFYAAAALNEHNPWFQVMPEITRYLQRMSFLLRQGRPANDIAVYLPTDDAWAKFKLGKASVDQLMESLLGPALIPQILNAGYNFDFVDDRAIEKSGLPWKLVVVPGVERMPLATLQRLQKYAQSGGILVVTRKLPSRAPGLLEDKTDTPQIGVLAREVFQNFVTD